jgi:hypothetical protein
MQLYVLWVNRVQRSDPFDAPNFLNVSYIITTSQTPDGPFTVINTKVQILAYGNPGDFSLFVDEDDDDDDDRRNETGKAYIAYDAFANLHRIQIEQLTSDYIDSLGSKSTTGPLTPFNNEAFILFKYYGHYYLLFGKCCCYSVVRVATHMYLSALILLFHG